MLKKNMYKKEYKNKGFTLVEVIVVLVILAILMAIAIPALTGYIDSAKNKAAAAEGRTLMNAFSSAAVEIFGLGDFVNGEQQGMLNWNGGSIQSWHNKNGSGSNPTTGYSMVANPKNGNTVLTNRALSEIAAFMSTDEGTIKNSLYCLIVEFDNTVGGKSDSVAGFVYKVKDDLWVAYNSKDGKFEVFPSTAEGFTYAKKCSPYFT